MWETTELGLWATPVAPAGSPTSTSTTSHCTVATRIPPGASRSLSSTVPGSPVAQQKPETWPARPHPAPWLPLPGLPPAASRVSLLKTWAPTSPHVPPPPGRPGPPHPLAAPPHPAQGSTIPSPAPFSHMTHIPHCPLSLECHPTRAGTHWLGLCPSPWQLRANAVSVRRLARPRQAGQVRGGHVSSVTPAFFCLAGACQGRCPRLDSPGREGQGVSSLSPGQAHLCMARTRLSSEATSPPSGHLARKGRKSQSLLSLARYLSPIGRHRVSPSFR